MEWKLVKFGGMKFQLSFLLFALPFITFCQGVIPVKSFNNFFMSFSNGFFNQIEVQAIGTYKAGDEMVAYIDNRGNLRLYDGKTRRDITNLNVDFKVSDHLLGYRIGPTLNMWDAGKLQTLTYFGRDYLVKDSIIVYEDTRFNTINVYWNKSTTTLATVMGDLSLPFSIGENIVKVVGLFDENYYPIYYEYIDYNFRIKNKNLESSIKYNIFDVYENDDAQTIKSDKNFFIKNLETEKNNKEYFNKKIKNNDWENKKWSLDIRRKNSWD